MKKIIFYICILTVLVGIPLVFANAVDCKPNFTGNYTVEGNCTWPAGWIKVFGDMNVWTRTITVPTGRVLWINLGSNKATFSTWKILFTGSARMDNSVGNRYYETRSFSSSSVITACPPWFRALNRVAPTLPTAYQVNSVSSPNSSDGLSILNAGPTGSFYCGK